MERVIVATALVAVAVVAARLLERRRLDPPTQARYRTPVQLDRADFAEPNRPWLVAVFTSETCDSCERAVQRARVLESSQVSYSEAPYQSRKDLHDRYSIDAVPLILLADAEGVVKASFVGVPTATDLWAAVAKARELPST